MVKNPPANAGDTGSIPGSGRSPGEGNGKPTPVVLPGESYGQRSLAGYSPWNCKSQTRLSTHTVSVPRTYIHTLKGEWPDVCNLLSNDSGKEMWQKLFICECV